jgi:hypothetical protein
VTRQDVQAFAKCWASQLKYPDIELMSHEQLKTMLPMLPAPWSTLVNKNNLIGQIAGMDLPVKATGPQAGRAHFVDCIMDFVIRLHKSDDPKEKLVTDISTENQLLVDVTRILMEKYEYLKELTTYTQGLHEFHGASQVQKMFRGNTIRRSVADALKKNGKRIPSAMAYNRMDPPSSPVTALQKAQVVELAPLNKPRTIAPAPATLAESPSESATPAAAPSTPSPAVVTPASERISAPEPEKSPEKMEGVKSNPVEGPEP